jgi:hypothetical protein
MVAPALALAAAHAASRPAGLVREAKGKWADADTAHPRQHPPRPRQHHRTALSHRPLQPRRRLPDLESRCRPRHRSYPHPVLRPPPPNPGWMWTSPISRAWTSDSTCPDASLRMSPLPGMLPSSTPATINRTEAFRNRGAITRVQMSPDIDRSHDARFRSW